MSESVREKTVVDQDEKLSQEPELSVAAVPTDQPASRAEYTTTRTELWAFYVYYIASFLYLLYFRCLLFILEFIGQ